MSERAMVRLNHLLAEMRLGWRRYQRAANSRDDDAGARSNRHHREALDAEDEIRDLFAALLGEPEREPDALDVSASNLLRLWVKWAQQQEALLREQEREPDAYIHKDYAILAEHLTSSRREWIHPVGGPDRVPVYFGTPPDVPHAVPNREDSTSEPTAEPESGSEK